MAVTFTVTPRHVFSDGGLWRVVSDVSCTGTPTVGGDALTDTLLGVKQMIHVNASGAASVIGGTSGAALALIRPATQVITQVLALFYVQGTAGAANSMVAYSGATAGFLFTVEVTAKTATVRTAGL